MQVKGTRYYRVKEVAERFDVSVATIYRAIESGQLKALRIGGGKGTVRIPEQALADFENGDAQSAPAAADELGEVA